MKNRVFDIEFKKMAIDLAVAKQSVKEAALDLGISPDLISKWKRLLKNNGSPSSALTNLSAEQQENHRLRKELRETQIERDILKKAVGIFSKSDGKSTGL